MWPRLTPSKGTWVSLTHSAPRRMVPSPPSTIISSMPSSAVSGLTTEVTRVGQPGIDGGEVVGRKGRDDAGPVQPFDQPVGRADGGGASGVGEDGHPARPGPAVALGCGVSHLPQHIHAPSPVEQHEELLVAGAPGQPARRHRRRGPAVTLGRVDHPAYGLLLELGRADHPTLRQPVPADLELRLDQQQQSAVGGGDRGERPDQQGEGDEGHVGHHQVDRPVLDVVQGQLPQVGLLPDGDPRVVPQQRRQLIGAHVDRDHLVAAPLQQHLGEAAGRGTGVQGPAAARSA